MKIQILYEENIRNGHKEYTTIDIPDGDYSVMLDIDYEQRLAEAKPEKRAEVKRCETVQEMFDLMNKGEYNDWRREHRYIDPNPKAKKMEGRKGYIQGDPEDDSFDIMDYLLTASDDHTDLEREEVCSWIRSVLIKKPQWAEAFIAVRIDGMSIRKYAATVGESENSITQKLSRAAKKLKEFYGNRKI